MKFDIDSSLKSVAEHEERAANKVSSNTLILINNFIILID